MKAKVEIIKTMFSLLKNNLVLNELMRQRDLYKCSLLGKLLPTNGKKDKAHFSAVYAVVNALFKSIPNPNPNSKKIFEDYCKIHLEFMEHFRNYIIDTRSLKNTSMDDKKIVSEYENYFLKYTEVIEIITNFIKKEDNSQFQDIDKNITVNTKDDQGNTLLHYAIEKCKDSKDCQDSIEVISTLLKKEANPNIQNLEGNTPLHLACFGNKWRIIQLLLEQKADPSLKNKREQNALYNLGQWSDMNYEIVSCMLQRHADPNSIQIKNAPENPNDSELNMLQIAVDSKNTQLGLHLLFHGAHVKGITVKENEIEDNPLAGLIKKLQSLDESNQRKLLYNLKFNLVKDIESSFEDIESRNYLAEIKYMKEDDKKDLIFITWVLRRAPAMEQCPFKAPKGFPVPVSKMILNEYLSQKYKMTKLSDSVLVKVEKQSENENRDADEAVRMIARQGMDLYSMFKNRKRKIVEELHDSNEQKKTNVMEIDYK